MLKSKLLFIKIWYNERTRIWIDDFEMMKEIEKELGERGSNVQYKKQV